MELVGMEGRMFVIPYIACVCGGAAVLLRIMACMSERATVLPPRPYPLLPPAGGQMPYVFLV